MSIASEITRLQNDSTAIASAIAAKGVSVPSGSGFDDYAGLIATIPTSGGGSQASVETTSAAGSEGVTQTFSGLKGEPIAFSIQCGPLNATAGTYLSLNTTRSVLNITYDGSTLFSATGYRSGSTARVYLYQTCTFSYSNGTLTVTSPGTSTVGVFSSNTYKLVYVY